MDKIFNDRKINKIRRKKEKQFICKYWYIHPVSMPTRVLSGHAHKIEWHDGLNGALYIKDIDQPYSIPLSIDSEVGIPIQFETEQALRDYIRKELEAQMLRKGSYTLTRAGAQELGHMIIDSLEEYVREGEEPVLIPSDFLDFLGGAKNNFIRESEQEGKFYRYEPTSFASREYIDRLASNYPFEFNTLNIVLNYVYYMNRLAIFSETEQPDRSQ